MLPCVPKSLNSCGKSLKIYLHVLLPEYRKPQEHYSGLYGEILEKCAKLRERYRNSVNLWKRASIGVHTGGPTVSRFPRTECGAEKERKLCRMGRVSIFQEPLEPLLRKTRPRTTVLLRGSFSCSFIFAHLCLASFASTVNEFTLKGCGCLQPN